MVLHHDVTCREHGVSGIVVEAGAMAQQLLDGDVENALVFYPVGVGRVVEQTLRSEYMGMESNSWLISHSLLRLLIESLM